MKEDGTWNSRAKKLRLAAKQLKWPSSEAGCIPGPRVPPLRRGGRAAVPIAQSLRAPELVHSCRRVLEHRVAPCDPSGPSAPLGFLPDRPGTPSWQLAGPESAAPLAVGRGY